MDLEIKLGVKELAKVEKTDVDISAGVITRSDARVSKHDSSEDGCTPLDDLVDEFGGQRLLRLIVA